ncbi:uncharacterized protein F4807DRAFT_464346 [Annulohypoxylon truncatum]|uniref:uncharacterized protein n=1 Tax=Annulohypoxylon truncatum TaxID=327061 RepID=UPI002008A869|nr:uncharacterized protein F4807DRAFT_464346 [Annulohypoxylon truncatum]KAI1205885.1 hypothetical protein F4807DRAFT_464346 [Annulohypoxylon truncatum]
MGEEEHVLLIRDFFSDQRRFQYIKTLSGGASGYCVCFREVFTEGLSRRFVVKCPNDDEDDVVAGIRNEIQSLHALQHAEHIVDVLTISDNPLEPDRQGQGGLHIPFIILEYVENGTLELFIQRIGGAILPNRFLWRLFLCMVRACVAMAYPPAQGRKEETVASAQPSALVHWDMHNRNFMFGAILGNYQEHLLVPILKLIDFDISAMKTSEEVVNVEVKEKFDDELELDRYRTIGQSSVATCINLLDVGQASHLNEINGKGVSPPTSKSFANLSRQ